MERKWGLHMRGPGVSRISTATHQRDVCSQHIGVLCSEYSQRAFLVVGILLPYLASCYHTATAVQTHNPNAKARSTTRSPTIQFVLSMSSHKEKYRDQFDDLTLFIHYIQGYGAAI